MLLQYRYSSYDTVGLVHTCMKPLVQVLYLRTVLVASRTVLYRIVYSSTTNAVLVGDLRRNKSKLEVWITMTAKACAVLSISSIVISLLLVSSPCHAFQSPPPIQNHNPYRSPLVLSDNKRSGYTTDLGYDQFLRKRLLERFEKRLLDREQRRKENREDGYEEMMLTDKRRSPLRALLKLPFRVAKRVYTEPQEPGTLILIRHGESLWNANQTFTGWADPDLSERGWREAEHAAR